MTSQMTVEEILREGWRRVRFGFEAHQVLEGAVSDMVGICSIDARRLEDVLEACNAWHAIGLQSTPPEKSPQPEGLLLSTSLMANNAQDWIELLRDNPKAIEQLAQDKTYANTASFCMTYMKQPHDAETLKRLWISTIEQYHQGHDGFTTIQALNNINYLWQANGGFEDLLETYASKLLGMYETVKANPPPHMKLDEGPIKSYIHKEILGGVAHHPRPKASKPHF